MRIIILCLLLIYFSCNREKATISDNNNFSKPLNQLIVDDPVLYKKFIYNNSLLLRNEFPIQKNDYYDMFRLHYLEGLIPEYTYGIIRQSDRVIVYYKENNVSGDFKGNGRVIVNESFALINKKINELLQFIEENKIFELEDGRKDDFYIKGDYFVLEINNKGKYNELYRAPVRGKQDLLWKVKLLFEDILMLSSVNQNNM